MAQVSEDIKKYVEDTVSECFTYSIVAVLVVFIVFSILLFVLWWTTYQEIQKKN